ncbi:MAG TPA: cysteine--tRNA ligase [Candidatus Norongarragalinales archaeon]|nr:cysteine--tRNA ligase [Candidatus Norongarragalinales archaeon]
MMRFFNSLSLKKEEFKPLKAKNASIYHCGPTAYDFAHIGNFRAYLFADLLRRWLEHEGYAVKQIMNITDVDDKTIRRSREHHKTLKEFTQFYELAFFEDLHALGIKRADAYPKATEHVPQMIALIEKLLKKGLAYESEDGVYYNIKKFKGYGKLSHLKIKGLKTGASGRVNEDEYEKESAQDFALWKKWVPENGNVFWSAPFGKGRPGWHIECSAMSVQYLGDSFDIHSGGVDLKFPHHENEIAQSEGASGKKFARVWLHNEHLLVDGKKMSKRFNNFHTLRDVLEKGFSAKAIRFLLLSTHYRSQLNFTFKALEHAENTLRRLNEFAFRLKGVTQDKGDAKFGEILAKTRKAFARAMNDDLGVAKALAVFFAFEKEFNKGIDEGKVSGKTARAALEFLKEFDGVFGVMNWAATGEVVLDGEAKKLIEEREQARKKKDFKRADEIRAFLLKKGIVLQDTPQGVVWKKA